MNIYTDSDNLVISSGTGAIGVASGWHYHYIKAKHSGPGIPPGTLLILNSNIVLVSENPNSQHSMLPAYKAKRVEQMNQQCRNAIIAGFASDALGAAHHYPFDLENQSNLMSSFLMAKELGVSRPFRCADANGDWQYRVHTVTQLQQVAEDADVHKMAQLVKVEQLRGNIAAATTPAEVDAVVW